MVLKSAPDLLSGIDVKLNGSPLAAAIAAWQQENLSAGDLARIQLVGRGAVATTAGVLVTFPNQETRKLAQGPSSIISKALSMSCTALPRRAGSDLLE